MQEHIVKDKIVTPLEVRKGEKHLNIYVRTWVRLCNIGGAHNHNWRVNRALISNFAPIPPMIGMRKDHKANIQNKPTLGPKLRPLCPANQAPNVLLGNMMASICRILANEHQV